MIISITLSPLNQATRRFSAVPIIQVANRPAGAEFTAHFNGGKVLCSAAISRSMATATKRREWAALGPVGSLIRVRQTPCRSPSASRGCLRF